MPNEVVQASANLCLLQMARRDRLRLDAFLVPYAGSNDARTVFLASCCRQALNVREVVLGRAKDVDELAFTFEEQEFLVREIAGVRDSMGEMLRVVSPMIPE